MLCWTCASIFQNTPPPFYDYQSNAQADGRDLDAQLERDRACIRPHHKEVRDLARAAVVGCSICDAAWRHFFSDSEPASCVELPVFWRDGNPHVYEGSGTHYRLSKPRILREEYGWRKDGFELEIGLNSPIDQHVKEFKTLYFSPFDDEQCFDTIKSKPVKLSDDVLDDATYEIVKTWMQNCQLNHPQCRGGFRPTKYPTRLIEMRFAPDGSPDAGLLAMLQMFSQGLPVQPTLRLIETAETVPTGPYVSVSYRWPESNLYQTTRANLSAHKGQVRNEDLPIVLQDAIIFAFRHHVRYIWIDALCIIQDDQDDWSREALTMGEVYSGAVFTISATAGEDSLFSKRNSSLIKPLGFVTKWTGFSNKSYVMCDFRFWEDRISKSVCNKRAWITQERWLSRRIVHFTFDQLLWECRELEAAESFPAGLPREMRISRHSGFKQNDPSSIENHTPPNSIDLPHESQYREWCKILSAYGRCELTFEEDKLVAIASIAKAFANKYKDEWLAGHWRRMFPGNLLWEVDKTRRSNKPTPSDPESELIQLMHKVWPYGSGRNQSKRPALSTRLATYQAPSWSWASVTGDILPGPYALQDGPTVMVTIVDVRITPLHPTRPLGRIKSASLHLKGTLYPLKSEPPIEQWLQQDRHRRLPPCIHITGLPKVPYNPPWSTTVFREPQMYYSHLPTLRPDEPVPYADFAKSVFLPISTDPVAPDVAARLGIDTNHVSGLCLLAVEGEKQGVYKRLGRIDWGHRDTTQLFADGWEAQKMRDAGLPGWEHKALSTTLDESLYLPGKLGEIEII